MQKPLLPIQIASASAAPVRAKASVPDGGAQFKQTLSREIEQRKAPPAKPNGPAKAQQHDKQDKPAAPAQSDAPAAPAVAKGKDAKADDTTSQTGAVVAQDPMADMLALMANFNQPAASAAAPVEAAETDVLAAAAPVLDGKLAAVAAVADSAGMDKLAAAGAAMLAEGAAPQAKPSEFGAVMARLDGKAQEGALPVAADRASLPGQQQAVPDQDSALATRTAQAAPGQGIAQPDTLVAPRLRDAVQPEAAPRELQVAAPLAAPLQQATQAISNAAHGVGASDKLAARVGTPGWDNQLGQKIVWMVAGKEQSASLTLNPPDMGPMQVVLNVSNDHASVTFSSATPEVRQALEDALPKLREMMSESGISLGNASVNDGSAQQQQQARDDAGSRAGAGRGNGERVETASASGSAAEAEAKAAARPARTGELPGLVDTFA